MVGEGVADTDAADDRVDVRDILWLVFNSKGEGELMKLVLMFPTILIVLDVAAGIVYACHGDVRRAIYWGAAAVLTATVTY